MRENKENCSVNHKHIGGVLLVFWPTMIVLHRDQMDMFTVGNVCRHYEPIY